MPGYTTPETLHLATLDGLREGLALLGVRWDPQVYRHEEPLLTNGLYAWVTGQGAVLHLGTAWHKDGFGLPRTLPVQMGAAVSPLLFHGHARTLQRLRSRGAEVLPYAGKLTVDDSFDLSWFEAAGSELMTDFAQDTLEPLQRAVGKLRADPYELSERFLVRLSMHLGDIGTPLNHKFRSAWDSGSSQRSQALDIAAAIVAARLRGELTAV